MNTKKGGYYSSSLDYQKAVEHNKKVIDVLKRAKRQILLAGSSTNERYVTEKVSDPLEIVNEIEELLMELIS
jgi:hypothetical protein